jgi:hypothetical protein
MAMIVRMSLRKGLWCTLSSFNVTKQSMALGKMTKGCRLLPLYQTSPIPLHLEVLQTLTSFFCLVLFLLHQLASHQLKLLDPQAMHQPGYQTGRMNLDSLMKPWYLLWSRKKHVCWQKFLLLIMHLKA